MARPLPADYPASYETYISLVQETDIKHALTYSLQQMKQDLSYIGSDKSDYAYSPGKWTVKQLVQHAIDTERIFAYRALCFARGEKQSLPGFEENQYADEADVSGRHIKDLKEELLTARLSTTQLYQGFSQAVLDRSGEANQKSITVLAIGYAIIGHWRHHASILQTRYGIGE